MARRRKSLSFRFHEIATPNESARNDKVFWLRPKQKTYSGRTYSRNVLIRSERSQGERRDKRRAYVTHKPILQRLQPVAIVCFLAFVFLFPHAKNCAFIFLTHTRVRLFLTCGSPCVCSTRMRGTVLRKPPRRRSGITRERYFSMRVPTSPLRAMCD